MRVRWTAPAAGDLYRIVRHIKIKQDHPTAAIRVVKILYQGSSNLRNFPHLGRRGRMHGTWQLVFPELPYIVVYRVGDQIAEIIRSYHGAQDWP